ncbi:MAG: type II secretion system F family protein [Nitrososphaerales archaeon]
MPGFKYIAVDESGKRIQGTVEALTKEDALKMVRSTATQVINLELGKERAKRRKLSEINLTASKSGGSINVLFFRQLSTLIDAGIPLDEALSIVKFPIKDKRFREAVESIHDLVKSGHALSAALNHQGKIFPRLAVSLLRAAEMGGGLGKSLSQISTYVEKDEEVKGKLKSATSYPKFIVGFFGLVLTGVVFGLLPKFKEIYEDLGAELPASTRIILGTSDFLRYHLVAELLLIALVIIGFIAFRKSPKGERFLDRSVISLPIFGSLFHNRLLTRLFGTMAVLLRSGVTLPDALRIAGEISENVYVSEMVNGIKKRVSEGRSFGHQLSLYPKLFPVMVSSMVKVGERSGSLPLMLEKIEEFSDRDFTAKVERLSKTLEPVMMAVLGVVICVVVVALYLPVFHLTSGIQ